MRCTQILKLQTLDQQKLPHTEQPKPKPHTQVSIRAGPSPEYRAAGLNPARPTPNPDFQVSRAGSQASSKASSKAVSRGDTAHDRGSDMAGRVVAMAALRSKTLNISRPEILHQPEDQLINRHGMPWHGQLVRVTLFPSDRPR